MEIKKLKATHGWIWVKQGSLMIFHNPILSIILAAIMGAGIYLATIIPVIGPLLAILLMPVLMAGYMYACYAEEQHEVMELAHLFTGFNKHTSQLISLGGTLLIGIIIISAVTIIVGGEAMKTFLENAQQISDPEAMEAALLAAGAGVANAMLVSLILLFLLISCLQFSPMLVIFDGANPLAALKTSFIATFRNLLPYIIYCLIFQLVMFIALSVLPFLLAMLLLLTFSMTSLYAAYRDIFPPQKKNAQPDIKTPDQFTPEDGTF